MDTTIQLNQRIHSTGSALPLLVVGLVEQLRRMITAVPDDSMVDSAEDKQSRSNVLVQLLLSSRLISEEQLIDAEKRSKASGLSLSDCLMSSGWITKDLLEAAQTLQIQIETGELGPSEAHAVLKGQKRLHDTHVWSEFFKPRRDIMQALPGEIECLIEEIFNPQPLVAMQPYTVAQRQLTAAEKAAYASRIWH